jgi:putative transposase
LQVKSPAHLWQARFYDFNVYSAKKWKEELDFMHANPMVRGLVSKPEYWMWSSFSFYETGARGLVTIEPL